MIFLPGSLLLFTMLVSSRAVYQLHSEFVLLGGETKEQFLARMLDDYEGLAYIKENLPVNARVLMVWDGRGYYCDRRCIPDMDQVGWASSSQYSSNPPKDHQYRFGNSHYIFINTNDRVYFLQSMIPTVHEHANRLLDFLISNKHINLIYDDQDVEIYHAK